MTQDSVKRLVKLCQLDIDAVFAYQQAVQNIDDVEIRNRINEFKQDHERHVRDLSSLIRSRGGEPPEFSKDFKGFLIGGFTAIRSKTGTEGALKAMQGNEQLTNKSYQSALDSEGLDPEERSLIERNREDERRHLEYIENCLSERRWERRAA